MKLPVSTLVASLAVATAVTGPPNRAGAQRSGTFDPVAQDERYEALVGRARLMLRERATPQQRAEGYEPPDRAVMELAIDLGRQTRFGRLMTGDDLRRFTALMIDPARSASSLASPWASAVTATEAGGEARVEANLTDLLPKDSVNAMSLAIATPLTKGQDLTDLVTLDGLIGTTRGELRFTQRATDASGKPVLTAKATAAAPRFAFRRADLSKDASRKAAFIVGVGFAFKWTDFAFLANYDYQNLYKAAAERLLCTELGAGPPMTLSCESAVLSGPTHVISNLVGVELRRQFRQFAAASVRLTRDLDHAATGVDVPVWFITQPAKKPSWQRGPREDRHFGGGIRIGYRSDAPEHATVSVFVGLFKL